MTETIAPKRLSKVAKEFNIATTTIVEFLSKKNIDIDANPNTKINADIYILLQEKFQSDKLVKEYADEKKAEIEKIREEELQELQESQYYQDDSKEVLIKSNLFKQGAKEEVSEPVKDKPKVEAPKKEEKVEEIIEETIPEPAEIIVEEKVEEIKEEKEQVVESIVESIVEEEVIEKAEEKEQIEITPEIEVKKKEEVIVPKEETPKKEEEIPEENIGLKVVGKIDLGKKEKVKKKETKEPIEEVIVEEAIVEEHKPEESTIETTTEPEEEIIEVVEEETKPTVEVKKEETKKPEPEAQGLKIVGKIELSQFDKKKKKSEPVASTSDPSTIKKKRRRVVKKDSEKKPQQEPDKTQTQQRGTNQRKKVKKKEVVDDKQIKDQISATLAKLTSKQQGSGVARSKIKKQKRREQREREIYETEQFEQNRIEVIEFITVNELANVMNVSVTEVITVCMNMGMMVNINQRLDAETITFVADEFGYEVAFKQDSLEDDELEEPDNEENLVHRAPVVTIMGHVDHGKTSLLDHIRKSKVAAGEAGGITQHIGAYKVALGDSGKTITFLDTPGHEAFTSMRARGAKVTDIVIIVVAADDSVMPQTKEAISHAQAAGVPIVFAINKIDKDGANPDRIKEQLADMNILLEDWGGKYQSQEISAKKGLNIDELLEKVLLEAELLELKADPSKRAIGTVVEATLDKGKGITTTILVESGTLRVGDPILAGAYYGRVKAMVNELGHKLTEAGPSTPVEVLGFDGAPTAGDKFYVTENEQKSKELANKRKRLIREQGIRATKHVTLDEIGRRIALGNFKELNIIIKGDVDGSVEALSDSIQKLSNEEVQVNVIHKGVGQISETDVMLATASDAIILGFQVRPSLSARKMAEKEEIDIRSYSVIYDAIEELKAAIEGMLSPTEEEKIVATIEVRDVFKITKVGTIAGCMVLDGKITRNTKIRVLREGVVIYTGDLSSLKRFKDDVKEVNSGYECGLGIYNFNDIKSGDIIEGFTIEKIKRTL